MIVNVVDSITDPDVPSGNDILPSFEAPRPCYLVDLVNLNSSDVAGTFHNRYHCMDVNCSDPEFVWKDDMCGDDAEYPYPDDMEVCVVYGPTGNNGGGDTSLPMPFDLNKTEHI